MKALASVVFAVSLALTWRPAAAVDLPPDDRAGPPIAFYASLSPDEESTPTESPGTGRVEFSLDRKTLQFSWKGSFSGLPANSRPTGIYLHGPQTVGGEAGKLFDLSPGSVKTPFEGAVTLTDAEVEYLVTGRFYVNLHTTKYPSGELRGEVRRLPPKSPAVTQ